MNAETEQERAWTFSRPRAADLLFLFVLVAVLVNSGRGLLDDPGLGWHLRNIDAMIDQRGWLSEDPFTDPRDGDARPWFTNQWLGELPFYVGWKLAGLEGIAVIAALIIASIARTLYRILIHDGLPWPIALGWTALGMLGTSCSWVARPNLFTILFVLIAARVVWLFHEGRITRRGTLWLLPLFAVWANTHGGFMAGFILVVLGLVAEGAYAVGSFDEGQRRAARARAGHLCLLLVGLFIATLVNPYGVGLYRNVYGLLGDKFFMDLHQEWKSPDFHSAGALRYEVLLLLFPFVLALSKRRPGLLELLTAVAWLHMALTGFRYMALWVVVALPMMARASVEIGYLQELARRWKLNEEGSLFHTRIGTSPIWWVILFAVGTCVWAHSARDAFIRPRQVQFEQQGQTDERIKPIVARTAVHRCLDLADEWQQHHGRRPRVFHSYDWGGYITWHGWPRVLNWIDDRNEVQGRGRVEEYQSILAADPGWEDKLAGVDLICIESGATLTYRLAADTERWRERYRDRFAVVFERIEPGS